jgi:hypothetical protein
MKVYASNVGFGSLWIALHSAESLLTGGRGEPTSANETMPIRDR